MGEQLQDANEVSHPGPRAEPLFEFGPQLGERGRQLPVAVHRRVIEGRGLPLQNHEKMSRIEDFFVRPVTPLMRGDHPRVGDDLHVVDEALDGHGAEGPASRHAVAVPSNATV